MFKRLLLSLALVWLCLTTTSAQFAMNAGVSEFSLNANATAAPQTGLSYAIPAGCNQLSWIISYASQPGSVSVVLELSNDNATYVIADTSTNVLGEARNIFTAARFVRTTESARTGGGAITTTLICKSSPSTVISGSTTTNTLNVTGQVIAGDGSNAAPAYTFPSSTGTGFWWNQVGGTMAFSKSNAVKYTNSTTAFVLGSAYVNGWSSNTDPTQAVQDTGISRTGAAALAIGNGTAADFSGSLKATTFIAGASVALSSSALTMGNVLLVNVTPTISSGFGTSPSIVQVNGGATTFAVNVGTGGAASQGIIATTAVTTGWHCFTNNLTAAAGHRADNTRQISSTTTTITIENQTTSTGAAVAWTASDIVHLICMAY